MAGITAPAPAALLTHSLATSEFPADFGSVEKVTRDWPNIRCPAGLTLNAYSDVRAAVRAGENHLLSFLWFVRRQLVSKLQTLGAFRDRWTPQEHPIC